ncbi:hypothetical protein AVEN_93847-1 [Araneus ventricosus]|uniref:Uncharacterized protein n=1 Tax=Araneus ventricosus TaxID=182803 RepID=A0A4Y2B0E7_ARAVE|nr:hypothetical protein AVEN_93847-1 [Araneus ventricosus]
MEMRDWVSKPFCPRGPSSDVTRDYQSTRPLQARRSNQQPFGCGYCAQVIGIMDCCVLVVMCQLSDQRASGFKSNCINSLPCMWTLRILNLQSRTKRLLVGVPRKFEDGILAHVLTRQGLKLQDPSANLLGFI